MFSDSKNPVDDHHIFPAAYLAQSGIPGPTRDAILNRTLIDRQTNIRIGMRAPSDYLDEIRDEWGSLGDFDGLLGSHLLPVGLESALFANDFEAFLRYREDVLVGEIERATGVRVLRTDDEEAASLPREIFVPAPGPMGGVGKPAARDVDEPLVRRAIEESPDSMKRFLVYLASEANRMVPNYEVADTIGLTRPQMAGMLGAFGRRWASRYAQGDAKWFFDAQWRPETGTDEWNWHYGVTEHVAAVIRAVLPNSAPQLADS